MSDGSRDLRRRQIMDAVVRITTNGGLQAATFRTIADEADVSVRLVQYYFGTKDKLLADTLAWVGSTVADRIATELEALGQEAPPRDVISTILEQFLPLDDTRRQAMLVFIAFRTAALTDAALTSSDALRLADSLITTIQHEFERAAAAGTGRAGLDPRSEAVLLSSAMTGLANSILAGEITATEARNHLDYALDQATSQRD